MFELNYTRGSIQGGREKISSKFKAQSLKLEAKVMKMLIINPFGIGDVLFSTPLIANLRQNFPGSYIAYICNIRARNVLLANPNLDEVFVFEKDEYKKLWKGSKIKCIKRFVFFLKKIKAKRFDVAIDLSLGRQYSFFLWLIGIKRRIGYNFKNRGRFLTQRIDIDGYHSKHIVEYYLDILKFLNVNPKGNGLQFPVKKKDIAKADTVFSENNIEDTDLVIGIIPAGGASWGRNFSYRHWLKEGYAQLGEKLIEKLNAKIILLGDFKEQEICQQIQTKMKHTLYPKGHKKGTGKAILACGGMTLAEFAALIGKCNLVICNDGGPLHIAVSQKVKTVSIFGPVDEKVYGPYPPDSDHTVVVKEIDCRPCYRRFRFSYCEHRNCLKGITPDEVFHAVKNSLGR